MMKHHNALASCVLVTGTSRGAGTSWLVTALCRWYARQGLRVAPFSARPASGDVRMVDGGPIGVAQYWQALAARAQPHRRMNPVGLQPTDDAHDPSLAPDTALLAQLTGALDELRANHDVVVIDGDGAPVDRSPAGGAGLALSLAHGAHARALLVADIDRGGAFAHLCGTWLLLDEAARSCIAGFVLNRFRGDPALLAPAPALLQRRTGVPTMGTVPLLTGQRLPLADAAFDAYGSGTAGARLTIAVVRYPDIGSGVDEFRPLQQLSDVRVVWAQTSADLVAADWIVLPGSSDTSVDLGWLRARGLDRAICAHAAAGGAVLGICAGLQLLGEALIDPDRIDGNAAGLGLLPLVTRFEAEQTLARTRATFGRVTGCWQALSGLAVEGYQVHHGRTGWAGAAQHPAMAAAGDVARPVLPNDLGWQNRVGNVLGTYLHGLFEDAAVLRALFGPAAPTPERTFDALADCIDAAFEPGALLALAR